MATSRKTLEQQLTLVGFGAHETHRSTSGSMHPPFLMLEDFTCLRCLLFFFFFLFFFSSSSTQITIRLIHRYLKFESQSLAFQITRNGGLHYLRSIQSHPCLRHLCFCSLRSHFCDIPALGSDDQDDQI